jgi:hypothetical protein
VGIHLELVGRRREDLRSAARCFRRDRGSHPPLPAHITATSEPTSGRRRHSQSAISVLSVPDPLIGHVSPGRCAEWGEGIPLSGKPS